MFIMTQDERGRSPKITTRCECEDRQCTSFGHDTTRRPPRQENE